MTLDAVRGIVYVPTGSAASDFYGADRVGDDLFANCLLALDARTGKRLWHFQGVHHDIWDRDFPSPPYFSLSSATANPSTPLHKLQSRASSIFSIASLANRFSPSNPSPIRLVTSPVKSRHTTIVTRKA